MAQRLLSGVGSIYLEIRMRKKFFKTILLLSLLSTDIIYCKGRYAETIVIFNEKKQVNYDENKVTNTITFNIRDTSPDDLKGFTNYDEDVIKRVIIKDLGELGTRTKFQLRDSSIRATIEELNDPYRLKITFFDSNFTIDRDPKTNLPIQNIEKQGYSNKREIVENKWRPKVLYIMKILNLEKNIFKFRSKKEK